MGTPDPSPARTEYPSQHLPVLLLFLIAPLQRGQLVATPTCDHMRDGAHGHTELRCERAPTLEGRSSGPPGAPRRMPGQNARDIGIAQPTRSAHRGFPGGGHGGVPSDAGGLPASRARHAAAQPSRPPEVLRRCSRARVPPREGLDGENGVIRSLEQAIRRPNRRSRPTPRREDALPRPTQRTVLHPLRARTVRRRAP